MSLGVFLPLKSFGRVWEGWVWVLHCMLGVICVPNIVCEAIWPWAFCCWRFSNHSFNFSAYDWSVHIFCFFLVQSWKVVSILFSEFVHFFHVVHFIGIWLLAVVFYDPLSSCGVHYNFSFSISNFIDMSSIPFFVMSHDNGLCIFSSQRTSF